MCKRYIFARKVNERERKINREREREGERHKEIERERDIKKKRETDRLRDNDLDRQRHETMVDRTERFSQYIKLSSVQILTFSSFWESKL